MDVIDGTDTRTRIILGFSRAEFDDLCEQLAERLMTTGEAGKILRFRSCFTDGTDPALTRCPARCAEGHMYSGACLLGPAPTAPRCTTHGPTDQLLQRVKDLERDLRVAENELSKWRKAAAGRPVETLDLEAPVRSRS